MQAPHMREKESKKNMLTALLVIAILVFLIVVHEFGHFIAAKIFAIRVDEFGIGYPPRAFSFGKWGETEYTLNWIPFGGFVRLFGEEEEHGRGSFADAPRWKQAVILVAGVTMNIVAAWGLFTGAYMLGILHLVDRPLTETAVANTRLIISDVVPTSPADAAGLKRGDELRALTDTRGAALTALTPDAVVDFIRERPGREIVITYLRGATTSDTVLTPAHGVVSEEASRPAVGIGLALVTTEALPFKAALIQGYRHTVAVAKAVWGGLSKLIIDAVRGSADLKEVVGPVGLVGVVGEAAQNGWGYVLSLAGFISVNLAIINLIPIPALDGGRIAILALESAMRRQAPRLAVQMLNALGIALIILLMVTVTYNDIARLLT